MMALATTDLIKKREEMGGGELVGGAGRASDERARGAERRHGEAACLGRD